MSPGANSAHLNVAQLVSERYLSREFPIELRQWYNAVPGTPLQLREFLRPEVACDIAGLLPCLDGWAIRCQTLASSTAPPVDVSEETFFATPPVQRFAYHDVNRCIGDALVAKQRYPRQQLRAMRKLLAIGVTENVLRQYLAESLQIPLNGPTSFEFARYRKNQWLGPHADSVRNRRIALNIYLDPGYQSGDGGELGYKDSGGREYTYAPEFNSVTLFRTVDTDLHWVSEYTSDRPGRYVVAMGFHE